MLHTKDWRCHSSSIKTFVGGCNMQFTSLLLYCIHEEFSFLLSEVYLSLSGPLFVSHPAWGSPALQVIPLPHTYQRIWGFYNAFHASGNSYVFHCRIKCANHPWHELCDITLVMYLTCLYCGSDREHLGSCGDDNAK